jgi:hypothetical protein
MVGMAFVGAASAVWAVEPPAPATAAPRAAVDVLVEEPPGGGGVGARGPRTHGVDDVRAAWRALPSIRGQGCGDDLVFDYGDAGGLRNFFCRALTVFSWNAFLGLAPTAPFRSGPHPAGRLDLHAARDFGRYDPAFVRWAVARLAPGIDDGAFRAETQGIYDAHIRPLARTVRAVRGALVVDPRRLAGWQAEYRAAIAAGRTDVLPVLYDLLGDADHEWGGYDPNIVRSAALWWLRRELDGTAPLWAEGLERLVGAYDGPWARAKATRPRPPKGPANAPEFAPEYRSEDRSPAAPQR